MINQLTLHRWLNRCGLSRDRVWQKDSKYDIRSLLSRWIWQHTSDDSLLDDPLRKLLHVDAARFASLANHIRKFNDPSRTKMVEEWAQIASNAAHNSIHRLVRVLDFSCGVVVGVVVFCLLRLL